ncbi:MarR family winged helix-turn-helix transcriptional regulator [Actinoplanes palleronii]|uniref:MarR family transcriptional regulator n=1 Tax=Actinoplanes palleronii TaxID=113570 RepID=A0ABQ4B9J9_9ACTN|nr:MarR family winged helix-turn-helix transcriptional regulator [Actinoplanes palleronii]GIE67304.1 hypothetical protein Apa02nite_034120 [Actinoplanes palleronii]
MNTTEFRPIGLLLRRLDQLIDERFDATLGARGVTRRQWQVLRTLEVGPGSPATLTASLAPFLATGEPVETHLSPLLGGGYVEDRAGVYTVTAAGRDLLADLGAAVRAIRDVGTAGITADDYTRTLDTLETMIANLEPGPGRPVPPAVVPAANG